MVVVYIKACVNVNFNKNIDFTAYRNDRICCFVFGLKTAMLWDFLSNGHCILAKQ